MRTDPRSLLLLLCLLGGLLTLPAARALAVATHIVTKTADTNDGVCNADCSLREAIAAAGPGDTIQFAVTGTITLMLGQLQISQDLTITGPGAALLAISGNHASQVFVISGGTVHLDGLTIQDGLASFASGGGVLNNGTTHITDSVVTNNSAPGGFGGGICNNGTMTIDHSTISDNHADGAGSGGGWGTPSGRP